MPTIELTYPFSITARICEKVTVPGKTVAADLAHVKHDEFIEKIQMAIMDVMSRLGHGRTYLRGKYKIGDVEGEF